MKPWPVVETHDPFCLEADLCGGCDRAVCICYPLARAREDEQQRHSEWAALVEGQVEDLRGAHNSARAERLEALQKVAALDDQLATARAEVAALRERCEILQGVIDGRYVALGGSE